MTPDRARTSRDGYILVAVLGVMLLLTGFMAAGSLLVRSALDTTRVGAADAEMSGLTQGGMELTAYQLFVIKAAPNAIDGRRIKFAGGTIAPRIVDEGGKADLNASDPKLLTAVFQAAGLDARNAGALVSHVVAIRGADRNPATDAPPGGSPQGSVSSLPAAQNGSKQKLRGFQSVDELMDFDELSPSDLRTLRPLLTVFNPDGKINIRSADPSIVKALPGLSDADAEVVLQRREGASGKDAEALMATATGAQPYLKTTFGPAFTVRVDATSAKGRKKAVHAVVAASKSPNDPYYVLDWWE